MPRRFLFLGAGVLAIVVVLGAPAQLLAQRARAGPSRNPGFRGMSPPAMQRAFTPGFGFRPVPGFTPGFNARLVDPRLHRRPFGRLEDRFERRIGFGRLDRIEDAFENRFRFGAFNNGFRGLFMPGFGFVPGVTFVPGVGFVPGFPAPFLPGLRFTPGF
jgi:hypothetical protein